MDKLKMQTANLADEKFKKLLELFPNIATETIDSEGKLVRAIDKDLLSQEINSIVVEGRQERYQFTWPGKKQAIALANTPINKTLRLNKEKSIGKDGAQGKIDSENIYIEGDNLDALKIIRETYLNRVKMIYIDPPYNTGNDFIYNDKFSMETDSFNLVSGQLNEYGERMVQNMESNGRFHTDWLNMMYPRLILARDFLKDDGIIFLSIDDNEYSNLKKICDEIFGSMSYVATIHCQLSTTQGMKVKAAQQGNIVKNAEYILCYSKNGHKNIAKSLLYDLRENYDSHYTLYLKPDGSIGNIKELYDYRYPKDLNNKKALTIDEAYKRSAEFAEIVRSHLAEIVRSDKVTGVDIMAGLEYGKYKTVIKNNKEYILTLNSNGKVQQLLRLKDSWGETDGYNSIEGLRKIRGDWWDGFYIDMGNISKEGDITFKNGKKPVRLIHQLIKMTTSENDIIMDFFSGSGTTAHATLLTNLYQGKRRYIMIQIPEKIDYEGYENICTLAQQRIYNSSVEVKSKNTKQLDIDYGFRVFYIGDTNYSDTSKETTLIEQDELELFIESIKLGVESEDLLIQVMLELGIDLAAIITKIKVLMYNVFNVESEYLIACFDDNISIELITELAMKKPIYAVFKQSSFDKDSMLANLEQIFNMYSPDTKRMVI
ncbi:MAG: site-specific DNA-methyltransferase [Veillonella sp.]|uniref:site-specific DNA-methyltransferase n=1 Tax=Veillonella sp. TaxID=1926307 RepID=UPI00257C4A93|nr:site-specific DNA-methyltransferase [Veillonella sp.]MBS7164262.1 site-specific DNA-methyltransferase [Veillonella sp.]